MQAARRSSTTVAADALRLLGAGEDAVDGDDAHAVLAPEHMRAPDGRGDDQRADGLMQRCEPDRDAGQHREDAEEDLRSEGRMDRDRTPARPPSSGRIRRAKMTSAATATQAHQRWMKWMR